MLFLEGTWVETVLEIGLSLKPWPIEVIDRTIEVLHYDLVLILTLVEIMTYNTTFEIELSKLVIFNLSPY